LLQSQSFDEAARDAIQNDQLKRICRNHTTPEQAGDVFSRVQPKLAVYNHLLLFGGARAEDLIPATREKYPGAVVVGEDLLQIDIGEKVEARPFRSLA
jgi:ribonuclease BN (tRNA processing enzyme)